MVHNAVGQLDSRILKSNASQKQMIKWPDFFFASLYKFMEIKS